MKENDVLRVVAFFTARDAHGHAKQKGKGITEGMFWDVLVLKSGSTGPSELVESTLEPCPALAAPSEASVAVALAAARCAESVRMAPWPRRGHHQS